MTATTRWPHYLAALAFIAIGYYVGWIGKDALVVPSFLVAFEYTDNLTTWVNFEGQWRSGILKQKSNPLGAAPTAAAQPALYK